MKTFQQFLTEALSQDSKDDLAMMSESEQKKALKSVLESVLSKTIGMRGYDTKVLYKELKKRYPNTRLFFGVDAALGDDYGYNYILTSKDKTTKLEDIKDYIILYEIFDQTDIYDPQAFYEGNKGKSDIHADAYYMKYSFGRDLDYFIDDVNDDNLQDPTLKDWLYEISEDGSEEVKLPKLWVQKLIKTKYLTKDDIKEYNIKLVDKI